MQRAIQEQIHSESLRAIITRRGIVGSARITARCLSLFLVLMFSVLALSACQSGGADPGLTDPRVGETAPDFLGPWLHADGNGSLSSFAGQTVLIDFWATHCAPCRRSMPEIERLADEFADDGVVVLSVNVDMITPERLAQVRGYLAATGIHHDVLIDSGTAQYAYQVRRIPVIFIIGPDGNIARVYQGYTDPGLLRRALQAVTAS